MKKIYFALTLLCLLPCVIQAQSFRVTAVSDGEALSYAYVYLNGGMFGVADANGEIDIPRGRLHVGDTISVSYVGMNPAWAIYTEKLSGEPGCMIGMEIREAMDAVEVTSRFNIQRFFNRNVRKHFVPGWWKLLSGPVTVELDNDAGSRTIQTRFFYGAIPDKDGLNEAHIRTGIDAVVGTEQNDSIAVYSSIFHSLWRMIDAPCLLERADMNAGMIVRYRGEREGKRYFLIARYMPTDMDNYQLLLVVDKETREIERAELEMYFVTFGGRLACKADYTRERIFDEGNVRNIYIYPSRLEADMVFRGARIACKVTMPEIGLRAYNFNEQKKLVAERDANIPDRKIPFQRSGMLWNED